MLSFFGKCPYCSAQVSFMGTYVIPWGTPRQSVENAQKVAIVAQCPNCYGVILGVKPYIHGVEHELFSQAGKSESYPVRGVSIIPEPPPIYYEESVPEDIRKAFYEVQKAFRIAEEDFTLHAMGCRAVVERALKIYLKEILGVSEDDIKGISLKKAIDRLVKECILPEPMGEWAHHIRLLGNEATHELSASKEEVKELINFTRFLLDYLFVLPCKLQRATRSEEVNQP